MQMLSFAINLNLNNFLTAHHVKINKDSAQQIEKYIGIIKFC